MSLFFSPNRDCHMIAMLLAQLLHIFRVFVIVFDGGFCIYITVTTKTSEITRHLQSYGLWETHPLSHSPFFFHLNIICLSSDYKVLRNI